MIEIKKLHLDNFKCFSKADIDFGKITIIAGANSSGKSSLMYALLGVLQSNGFPNAFSTNGSYLDMGDYTEMVLNHDPSQQISISFQIKEDSSIYDVDIRLAKSEEGTMPFLSLLQCRNDYFFFRLVGDIYGGQFKYDLDYFPDKNPNVIVSDEKKRNESIASILNNPSLAKANADELVLYLTALGKELRLRSALFDADNMGVTKDENTIVLFHVVNEFSSLLKRTDNHFNFISSFRMPPERTYMERSAGKKIGAYGDGFVDVLMKWMNTDRERYNRLISILGKMGILSDIKIDQIQGGRFNVLVKTTGTGPLSSLNDVGFGVSQILPVVIADLELGDNSTLFCAQPEIHLHPSVQADYASYLMEQVASGSKRYIIETHSEYIINRIRLGIAKGMIAEEDVKVYFLKNENGTSKIYPLTLTSKGQILGAPEDFFKTYMIDVMNIAIEAAE